MIPHTALSFAYHVSIVPSYRDELHTDVRQALRRFEVEKTIFDHFASGHPIVQWTGFLAASLAIERAAYAGRATPGKQLKVPMAQAAAALFDQIAPHLAWEVAYGRPSESEPQPSPSSGSLLESVYLLFYSSVFRKANASPPSSNLGALPSATGFAAAWAYVRGALETGKFDEATLPQQITVLMEGLAYEYSNASHPLWHHCW